MKMGDIIILVETREGKLRKATLTAISAGKVLAEKTGLGLNAVVFGSEVAAEEVSNYGLKRIYLLENPILKNYIAEVYADAIKKLLSEIDVEYLIATHTTFGKDILPRLSAILDAGMASDILEIVDGKTFKRPMFAGNVTATITLETKTKVISVRGTAFPKAEKVSGKSEIIKKGVALDEGGFKARFVKFDELKSARPELTEAEIIVSGGRGVKGSEGFKNVIEPLADVLGAAVGASRAAVDSGFVPNDLQVGQTGKIVAPTLYIAAGISGAIQHLAGMKDSKVIVAVNKDSEAPIFQVTDYGIVGDLFKVLPEMTEKIRKIKEEEK